MTTVNTKTIAKTQYLLLDMYRTRALWLCYDLSYIRGYDRIRVELYFLVGYKYETTLVVTNEMSWRLVWTAIRT
jgi:hypothetical protein